MGFVGFDFDGLYVIFDEYVCFFVYCNGGVDVRGEYCVCCVFNFFGLIGMDKVVYDVMVLI